MRLQRRSQFALSMLAVLTVALFALPGLARFWVDARWFGALGHTDVLYTPLLTKLSLGVITGAAVTLLIGVNLSLAARLTRARPSPLLIGEGERGIELDVGQIVGRLTWPVAALTGLLVGLSASGGWTRWLLFRHGQPFHISDPLFGRDISFYVFTLPFLNELFVHLFFALLVTLILTTALYVARAALVVREGRPHAQRETRVHLSVLGAAVFLVLAFGAWLSSAELAYSQEGLFAGAGYADVHARLPMLRAHVAVAIVSAVLVVVSATKKRLTLVGLAVVLYLGVGVLGRGIYPTLIQQYVVEPNELERERPYIERVIEATRAAYGLDHTDERELSGDFSLEWSDIEANRATVDNVRLWDHRPLLDTFGQIQEIRTYYDFVSVDNDRYTIDGELRQTMLSPRELSTESLPNRTWINEHLTFTHGYGLTLGPVNEADGEGLPRLFVRDIPPVSTAGESLRVERPQIYFGELGASYVFVGAENREFDHPSGEGNVFCAYDGPGGVEVGSHAFRAALAIYTGSMKVLLSDDLTDDSRIMLHRRITDRVRRLAPFLTLDGDPYMVLRSDGTLAWILDGYTSTDRYPYSRRTEDAGLSYVRNSVKVVVDAYSGAVDLYANDDGDPILRTWSAIFPDLLTPLSEMPADLRAHLRYPSDIFDIQARMLATFHMDRVELLYNREDQWEVPTLRHGGTQRTMEPYYTVMRLPGEERAEFIQMLPFTPARKDNLAAWMVARSDGEHLGELMVYRFPNDRLVYGPQQVLNRINQDAHISQQLSLWDQRGSQADFGTLLVIPIEESLIYALPLYLRSEGGRIPQLKRVIVVYENRIAMAETLDEAIFAVFDHDDDAPAAARPELTVAAENAIVIDAPTGEPGTAADDDGETPTGAAPPGEDPASVRALRHYERAVAAQREGDWERYGVELEHLEAALRAMQPPTEDPGAVGRGAPDGNEPEP